MTAPRRGTRAAVAAACWLFVATAALAQAPVSYTLSFPQRAHRLMNVEVTFPDVASRDRCSCA